MDTIQLTQFDAIGARMAQMLKQKYEIKDVNDFLLIISQKKVQNLKYQFEQDKIDPNLVDKWVEILDLFRIPMMSAKEAEMLRAININSVEELAHRDPGMILNRLRKLDEDTYFIVLEYPSISKIETWIYYAKLMSRRMVVGYAYPLISFFPLVKMEHAMQFQKYRIWTVEDFVEKYIRIPKLQQFVGMSKKEWEDLINIMDLVKVDGIEIYSAKLLTQCGIKTLKMLKDLKNDINLKSSTYKKIKIAQSEGVSDDFLITESLFDKIIENAQQERSIKELTAKWR
jgi:hypothetical protein